MDRRYEKDCAERTVSYREWVAEKAADCERGIRDCETMGDCEAQAVLLGGTKGEWTREAEKIFASFFAANPEVLIAYGDEDVETKKGIYADPWLKPDWSPDTFLNGDYLGGAVAVRKSFWNMLLQKEPALASDPITILHEKITRAAGGFQKGAASIRHVTGIFFHRSEPWENEKEMIEEEKEKPEEAKLLSVIIPSRDNAPVLKKCIETFRKTSGTQPYEIWIVDNGSTRAVKRQIEEYVAGTENVHYLYEPMEFNFSGMCNLGAAKAAGDLLLFLNDDIEALHDGWLEKMVQKALQPWTGAVGCKLLYPDTDRIQHAGITNLPMGPVHKLQFLRDNKCYYDSRNRGIRNCLAVTGACLMVRREVYNEAGGFCENMQVAFNDVDFCFTLWEAGYFNVVVNSCHLLHHESLSRGTDESEEKLKRLQRERKLLYDRHPALEGKDPFYHDWLNRAGLDTRVLPEYLTGKVMPDQRQWLKVEQDGKEAEVIKSARKDRCLLLRVESADSRHVQGYGVVLGSDNACFTGKLLFEKRGRQPEIYEMEFTRQYRSDLQENMPDQINVALCGFHVEFKETLPEGEYRIGIYERDRISGSGLINYCNRTLIV